MTDHDIALDAAARAMERLFAEAWCRKPSDPPHPESVKYARAAITAYNEAIGATYTQEDMDREIARAQEAERERDAAIAERKMAEQARENAKMGWRSAEAQVATLTAALREVEWDDVLNCVEAAMNDRCEPERYRESYTKAYAAVTKLAALSEGGDE